MRVRDAGMGYNNNRCLLVRGEEIQKYSKLEGSYIVCVYMFHYFYAYYGVFYL
jgi:hypothetical protein